MDELQHHRNKALAILWELMKKQGAHKYKYAVPQVELAKTTQDIDTVCRLYGIDLGKWKELQKNDGKN